MKHRFIVPGRPVGYTATTHYGKWNQSFRKYAAYAKLVRECAREAGIKLPLGATEKHPLIVKTIAYFPNRVHCDPGNVQKGVCDALFYDEAGVMTRKKGKKKAKRRTKKGDDKFTGGAFPPPRYDKDNPRVIVIIKDYIPKHKESDQ